MRRRVLFIVALVAVAGIAFCAGRILTLKSVIPAETTAKPSVVTVNEQTVGKTLQFNATLKRETKPLFQNNLMGTITAVSEQTTFDEGDLLYKVANRSVRVVTGPTPFYRDLEYGATGPDVQQLSDFLQKSGYLSAADDSFGQYTAAAVKAWKKDAGEEATDVVRLGELIAVPSVPVDLRLDRTQLQPGLSLAGGEKVVSVVSQDSKMLLLLNDEQRKLLPVGAKATLTYGDHSWPAIVGTSTPTETEGFFEIALTSPSGGVPCGAECGAIPGDDKAAVLATIEVVPNVTGPAVPRASIRTNANGISHITTAAGEDIEVEILGATNGIAVVKGVELGIQILVFGAQ